MENNSSPIVEPEYECQICMDLLIEPVTTVCGHTFCKICLIRYLKTTLNCPMCRKPILQSRESLSKNILLENLIKSKYLKYYDEKLKVNKILYDESSNSEDDNKRQNIPAIILEDCFVWPQVKRKLIITNMYFDTTISISSINDRLLVIIPSSSIVNNPNGNENIVSSLVELSSINKFESRIEIEVTGRKRFKVSKFENASENSNNVNNISNMNSETAPLFICSGEIIKDLEISTEESQHALITKLKDISEMHSEILKFCPYSILQKIERQYGRTPNIVLTNNTSKSPQLESFSFYFLNLIKNEEKRKFYLSSNVIERVNW
jgi:hypothetical protein